MKKNDNFFYIFLFIICVAIRCFLSYTIFPGTVTFEEAQTGGTSYFLKIPPILQDKEFLFTLLMTKASLNIFEPSLSSLRISFILIGIFTLFLFIYTLKKYEVNKLVSFIFSIFFASYQAFTYSSLIADESLLAINLSILTFLTMLLIIKNPNIFKYVLIFLLFSISFYEYITLKLFMVFYFTILFIYTLRKADNRNKKIIYFIIGLLIFGYITYPYWFSSAFWDGPQRHLSHGNDSIIDQGWKSHFVIYYEWFFETQKEYPYHNLFYFYAPKIFSITLVSSLIFFFILTLFSSHFVFITNVLLFLFTLISSSLIAYNCDIKRLMPSLLVFILQIPFLINIILEKYKFKFLKYLCVLFIIPIIAFDSIGIKRQISYEKKMDFFSSDGRTFHICNVLTRINKEENNNNPNNVVIYPIGEDVGEGCTNDFIWLSKFNENTRVIKEDFNTNNIQKDKIYFIISIYDLSPRIQDKISFLEENLGCKVKKVKIYKNRTNLVYFKSADCNKLN